MSTDLTDEAGLIRSLAAALEAASRFEDVYPSSALEILYTVEVNVEPVPEGVKWEDLGFDVACAAPFWSPVVDIPGEVEPLLLKPGALNSSGLFSNAADASAYRQACLAIREVSELDLLVCHVWAV
jgi:hypothetical protein